MQIQIINNFTELMEHEKKYRDFLNQFNGVGAQFYSIEHVQISFQHFESFGYKMYFLLCFDKDNIIALFPFQRRHVGPRGLIKKISFWGDVPSEAANLFKMFLISKHHHDVTEHVASYLKVELSGEWDTIEIYRLFINKEVEDFISQFNTVAISDANQSYVYKDTGLPVSKNNERKYKKIVKTEKRLLKNIPDTSFVIDTQIDENLYNELADLHTNHQLTKIQYGNERRVIFQNNAEYDYLRKLYTLWGNQGWLRCYRLVSEEKTMAYLLARKSDVDAFVLLMAFNNKCRKYDPTRILLYKATGDLLEKEGCKMVDFAWGGTKPKEDFANYLKPLHNIIIKSARTRSQVLLIILSLVKSAFNFIRSRN